MATPTKGRGELPPGYGGHARSEARLEALVARGARRELIGESRDGRPIAAYFLPPPAPARRLSPPVPGDHAATAPAILVVSLLHPMEWIGLETLLSLLEGWADNPPPVPRPRSRPGAATAAARADLSPRPRLVVIPVANPDGFDRVERSLRANRPCWVRGNGARVDLNRNFPAGHRRRIGLLDRWPIYRPGPFPLSEPECAAIASLARTIRPSAALSLHSFGRWVFTPPARRLSSAERRDPVRQQREEVQTRHARRAVAGTGYRACPLYRWSPFFRAGGTELDFLHEAAGAASYLVEISAGGLLRWGPPWWRHPFALFNPPRPEREIARVLPILRALIAD